MAAWRILSLSSPCHLENSDFIGSMNLNTVFHILLLLDIQIVVENSRRQGFFFRREGGGCGCIFLSYDVLVLLVVVWERCPASEHNLPILFLLYHYLHMLRRQIVIFLYLNQINSLFIIFLYD